MESKVVSWWPVSWLWGRRRGEGDLKVGKRQGATCCRNREFCIVVEEDWVQGWGAKSPGLVAEFR